MRQHGPGVVGLLTFQALPHFPKRLTIGCKSDGDVFREDCCVLVQLPVLPPKHRRRSTFLFGMPPWSASHILVTPSFSPSPVNTNSLNHSPHALTLPEWRQHQLWFLSWGPKWGSVWRAQACARKAKDGESTRHQELMTISQEHLSAASHCFEAYFWLSGMPWGQAGRSLHGDCWQASLGSYRWAG